MARDVIKKNEVCRGVVGCVNEAGEKETGQMDLKLSSNPVYVYVGISTSVHT